MTDARGQGEAFAWRLRRRAAGTWNLWDSDPRLETNCDYSDARKWEVQPLYATPAQPDSRVVEALREAGTILEMARNTVAGKRGALRPQDWSPMSAEAIVRILAALSSTSDGGGK